MCDFSGPSMDNYKGFSWKASQGKIALSTPDLVHSPRTTVSKGNCCQGLCPLGLPCSSHIFIASSGAFTSKSIWRLQQRSSSSASAKVSLSEFGKRRGNLKDNSPPLSVPSFSLAFPHFPWPLGP